MRIHKMKSESISEIILRLNRLSIAIGKRPKSNSECSENYVLKFSDWPEGKDRKFISATESKNIWYIIKSFRRKYRAAKYYIKTRCQK